MDKKKKLITLLGSAVVFGLGSEAIASSHGGEGKCAGMKKGPSQTQEATCAGMKKDEKEKTKKKPKEGVCAGQGTCGGKMDTKEGGKS